MYASSPIEREFTLPCAILCILSDEVVSKIVLVVDDAVGGARDGVGGVVEKVLAGIIVL